VRTTTAESLDTVAICGRLGLDRREVHASAAPDDPPAMVQQRSPSQLPALAAVAGSFGRDVGRSLARIERLVGEARARGAGMVVLPECALGGYLTGGDGLALDGPEIARLAEIAGDMVVCAGFTEAAADGGAPHSSAVCVSGDGVLGHHRKVHVPPSERSAFTPGSRFAACDTPIGRVGMLICYDKVFPEAARSLALDGAEIVASMSAWPVCRFEPAKRIGDDRQTRQFNLLDQARAMENQVVWVSSNVAGRAGTLRFMGQAKVVAPDGEVLARTGGRPGLAVASVDVRGEVAGARGFFSHLSDMAPAAYRVVSAA
jgi:N-carbamoylputrescine amidase